MAMGIAGWFIDEKGYRLGTMTTREGDIKFIVSPRANTFGGPLAVLIDGLSASTSEILAGGLKDLERARLFGTATAGAALPSMIEKLPNGDGFQYAIANYVSQNGETLEGSGVIPHLEVIPTREKLLEGGDPVAYDPTDVHGHGISIIFQEPMTALNPTMRVGDLIAEGPRIHHGLDRKAARAKAVELMRQVVANEYDRHPETDTQFLEESEDLVLDRHVESSRRFIAQQQAGLR